MSKILEEEYEPAPEGGWMKVAIDKIEAMAERKAEAAAAPLRTRIDDLEARIAALEANG